MKFFESFYMVWEDLVMSLPILITYSQEPFKFIFEDYTAF